MGDSRIPSLPPPIAGGEIDLHTHTKCSDGTSTPCEVIDLAKAAGILLIGITDHNTACGLRDSVLRKYVGGLDPRAPQIVPGVEITTSLPEPIFEHERVLHIVGLGVNPNHPVLRKRLIRQRVAQEKLMRDRLSRLRDSGFDVQWKDMWQVCGTYSASPYFIAKLLLLKGLAPDLSTAKEIVSQHCENEGEILDNAAMRPAEAIALIHQAGGVAILAHPHREVRNHDPEILRRLFADLKDKGLDAVEGYRQDMDDEVQPLYHQLIQEAGLLLSGGSDYHNPHWLQKHNGVPRHPGDAKVPARLWPPFAALIKERGGITDLRDLIVAKHESGNANERFLF
ncbi:MAG: hypothetical protein A2289_03610 [Deltaproteobacteria bacterium RIFOXYA12_FULL_58_15]|nr:MAG: hypothetical protein A2289_03610 [Deltaproteobacteria bacterium RIFOXYA12_FULL_58_15]OGR12608.1 MAG: hypothetical protein A2341_24950 [Deltaproteobacteria bacterium RIFOXYB12_FULL_58_9]